MSNILVVGVDSIPGQAVFQQLTGTHSLTGLTLQKKFLTGDARISRISKTKLKTELASADVIIFSGDAARSSWDSEFGSFDAEEKWLEQCLTSAKKLNSRIVMVSSDAVFNGPWLFHDDDCQCLADSSIVRKLLDYEKQVAALPNSLIIRTNVLGYDDAGKSFCSQLRAAFFEQRKLQLEATTSSTPVASETFGKTVGSLLTAETKSYVNIGGAERTTAFHFATLLATLEGYDTSLIHPKLQPQTIERSLRCERIRTATNVKPPMLKETVEALQQGESERTAVAA